MSALYSMGLQADSIELQFDKFWRLANQNKTEVESDREYSKLVVSAYWAQIAKEQTPEIWMNKTLPELQLLFRAAKMAAEATQDYRYAVTMSGVILEMEKRKPLVRKIFYTGIYRVYLLTRHFEQARQVRAAHEDIIFSSLPSFRESSALNQETPTAWSVDFEKSEFYRHNVILTGSRVFVVSHPSCHFTWNALTALKADPALSSVLFGARTSWLLPQSNDLGMGAIRVLNDSFPGIDAKVVVYQSEWASFDSWATPTFYFLKDGLLVAKVVGWPEEGNRKAVLAGLQKIGL